MGYISYPKETKDKAVEMYIDGKAADTIAAEIGCSNKAVLTWVQNAGFETRGRGGSRKRTTSINLHATNCTADSKGINPLLLSLAGDNDLTPYIGKEITKMQPREIFRFLELLNIQGKLTLKQTVTLK